VAVMETMEQIAGSLITGVFTLLGVILGQSFSRYNNRTRLVFVPEGTPDCELVDKALRTKTSLSEWSVRIYNIGTSPYFPDHFYISYRGNVLVECHDVCTENKVILPSNSYIYTLMEQDASALQYNFSKYYKEPGKIYMGIIHLFKKIPIVRNHIVDPEFRQGICKVTACDINGKQVHTNVNLSLLYIRHRVEKEALASTIPPEGGDRQ